MNWYFVLLLLVVSPVIWVAGRFWIRGLVTLSKYLLGSERQQKTVKVPSYVDHLNAEHARVEADMGAAGFVTCTERVCVMPSRRIDPSSSWHLVHDYILGGPFDHLGPAHLECTEHESRQRELMGLNLGAAAGSSAGIAQDRDDREYSGWRSENSS